MADLAVDDIIVIHSRITARVGGDTRVLSEAVLHQVTFQVNLSADLFHKAAIVLFSFSAYPPFRERNSETALCLIKQILETGGYWIDPEMEELASLVRGVESFSLEIEDLENWLHTHAQKRAGP